jgi:hypothetical protein
VVAVLPDLYPKNVGFPHETPEQLYAGTMAVFDKAAAKKRIDDTRLRERFHVFCFKHDLEALILASEEALKVRLDTNNIGITWKTPVEDQNHNLPPKAIVQKVFCIHGVRYRETADAPVVLGLADLSQVTNACPQCFKPFVEFLKSLSVPV